MKTFIDYMRQGVDVRFKRSYIIGMLAYIPDRSVYPIRPVKKGHIVFKTKHKDLKKCTYGYYDNNDEFQELEPLGLESGAPFAISTKIHVKAGDLENISSSFETTVGRFIANYMLISSICGKLVPFKNKPFKTSQLEQEYASFIMEDKMTVAQYKQYVDQGYRLLHMCEILAPTFSEKSLCAPKEILDRRDELLKKNADHLNDPKVVVGIEDELLAMYRAHLKDDPAMRFLGADPKYIDTNAKKMNIMVGGVEDFGGKGGEVVTGKTSISEGWKKENITAIANEIRRGSYSRGHEVRKGGAMTKLIFRAFQDIVIHSDNCGTDRGITISFDNVVKPEMFLGRHVMKGKGTVVISLDNIDTFRDKTVTIRSPMTCASKNDVCYTCAGEYFRKLKIKNPGTLVIAISSGMLSNEMKSMHGTKIQMSEITDPFKYIV